MQKGFWLILLAALAIMAGLFFMVGGNEEEPADGGAYSYDEPGTIQEQDHTKGTGSNSLIEYGDFQCPGCASLFPLVQQVVATRSDDVTFVFRHFPLTAIHPNAMAAHRAAEAAGRQGKFWEMHDLLYERQTLWSSSGNAIQAFEGYAEELELDMEKYRTDAASDDVFKRISADMASGKELGITGTPSLLFNGERVTEIPQSLEAFNALIDGSKD